MHISGIKRIKQIREERGVPLVEAKEIYLEEVAAQPRVYGYVRHGLGYQVIRKTSDTQFDNVAITDTHSQAEDIVTALNAYFDGTPKA